jgi:hypothetical protein
MSQYSAQGSITIRRLRNGDTCFISFRNNGVPLFQCVDPNTGVVSPDWTIAENQPTLTPQVVSARGNTVVLSGHQWSYNGILLVFSGATSGEWTADTTGKFQMNASTGALKIVKNLASKDNPASDTLHYVCSASVAGVEQTLEKDVDIQIQSAGASSYAGTLTATAPILSSSETSTTLNARLFIGGTEVTDFSVKWYRDDELWSAKTGKSITVTREEVDWSQLVIAEFYLSSSDTQAVCRAAVRITDVSDEYKIEHRIVNSDGSAATSATNREVDTNKPVYVQAYVVNMKTGEESAIAGSWKMMVMDKDSWEILRTVTADGAANITGSVTTDDTDRDGVQKDVEVVSEVEW